MLSVVVAMITQLLTYSLSKWINQSVIQSTCVYKLHKTGTRESLRRPNQMLGRGVNPLMDKHLTHEKKINIFICFVLH